MNLETPPDVARQMMYGIMRIRNVTKNQRDEVVQSFIASAMLPMRGTGS